MWAYRQGQLAAGFPKRSFDPLYLTNPETVVKKQNKTYLSRGSFLVEFNFTAYRISDHAVLSVKSVFPGVPIHTQAALYDPILNATYFFKDKM